MIMFRPDAEIFETLEFSFDTLAERFREIAFLNRELDITLTDDRDPVVPRAVRFRFPGGPGTHIAEQGPPLHRDVIGFEREYSEMEGTVEVAFCWCDCRGQRGQQGESGDREEDVPSADGAGARGVHGGSSVCVVAAGAVSGVGAAAVDAGFPRAQGVGARER
ncbi:hypothetical protein [Streptomyces sp. FZ201]|uniref:hypothetical protein n=1 Tax=Streptomyces sp. FZ201 TaxID=3057122 RepID=UPI0021BE323D|nr:hypothetical protein [Streptomyces sp. FZ201]